ncbi:MAG: choice-of-anchor M domain-containing protein [Verrucomicrobia bacterium]|nr:choice-of-anchor M domain-containing protein [Verrucomicrobiota bacterium]
MNEFQAIKMMRVIRMNAHVDRLQIGRIRPLTIVMVWLVWAMGWAGWGNSLSARERELWLDGHGDIFVNYAAGEWGWRIDPGEVSSLVVVSLDSLSRLEVPENEAFEFLGEVGSPVWVIPQVQRDGVLFLGLNSETAPGVFADDSFELHLEKVDGPGDFFAWLTNGSGGVEVWMNSGDGVGADDRIRVSAPGHMHLNWGFSQPGTYDISFSASGQLAGGEVVTSPVHSYRFAVEVVRDGELDLEIVYDGETGEWETVYLDEVSEEESDTRHKVLHLGPSTRISVPEILLAAVPGLTESSIYLLPQDERDGIVFPGIATDEIAEGLFVEDEVSLVLKSVDGPGQFLLYQVDTFGAVKVLINSVDGIDSQDVYSLPVGAHVHVNWAVTEPGNYKVTFEAQGASASDSQLLQSPPFDLMLEAISPVIFTDGEIDIEMEFEDDALAILALEELTESLHVMSEILFSAGSEAMATVPQDAAFSFLGSPGQGFYVFPQSEKDGLPFIGLAADEIDTGLLADDQLHLVPQIIDGPGHFFLYSVDEFGAPTTFIDSSDGLDNKDSFPLQVGEHVHVNWAFSEPGLYRLSFRALAQLTGSDQEISSPITPFVFEIHPAANSFVIEADLTGDGRIQISWASQPGASYQVQSRGSAVSGSWTPVGDAIVATESTTRVTLPLNAETIEIIRVVQNP